MDSQSNDTQWTQFFWINWTPHDFRYVYESYDEELLSPTTMAFIDSHVERIVMDITSHATPSVSNPNLTTNIPAFPPPPPVLPSFASGSGNAAGPAADNVETLNRAIASLNTIVGDLQRRLETMEETQDDILRVVDANRDDISSLDAVLGDLERHVQSMGNHADRIDLDFIDVQRTQDEMTARIAAVEEIQRFVGSVTPPLTAEGEDLIRRRYRIAAQEDELRQLDDWMRLTRADDHVYNYDDADELEEGEVQRETVTEPSVGDRQPTDDDDVSLLELDDGDAHGGDPDDDGGDAVIISSSDAERESCPPFCGCHNEDATEYLRPVWSSRSSDSEGENGLLTQERRNNRPNLTLPAPVNIPVDSELEERTNYIYSILPRDRELGPDDSSHPVLDAPMHYVPLSTEDVLRTNPPDPAWLTDLYPATIDIDEDFGDPRDLTNSMRISIRTAADRLFAMVLDTRTILHRLLTTPEPATYLASQIPTLLDIIHTYKAFHELLWDKRPDCRRVEDALEYSTGMMTSIRRVILNRQSSFGPHSLSGMTWSMDIVVQLMAEHLHDMRSRFRDTGARIHVRHAIYEDMAQAPDHERRHLAECAIVFEYCRYVVRGFDTFFSSLRMEGWALRRMLAYEGDVERLEQYPTIYDSIVEAREG
jgi:hypothetical protein